MSFAAGNYIDTIHFCKQGFFTHLYYLRMPTHLSPSMAHCMLGTVGGGGVFFMLFDGWPNGLPHEQDARRMWPWKHSLQICVQKIETNIVKH